MNNQMGLERVESKKCLRVREEEESERLISE